MAWPRGPRRRHGQPWRWAASHPRSAPFLFFTTFLKKSMIASAGRPTVPTCRPGLEGGGPLARKSIRRQKGQQDKQMGLQTCGPTPTKKRWPASRAGTRLVPAAGHAAPGRRALRNHNGLACKRGVGNLWGIPTEVNDMNSTQRYREFQLAAGGPHEQDFYFTYARRLGARKVFAGGSAAPGLRFWVWAPTAHAVEVVFGRRDNGYIADDGDGIDPARPV